VAEGTVAAPEPREWLALHAHHAATRQLGQLRAAQPAHQLRHLNLRHLAAAAATAAAAAAVARA
jgi:hypothetical protein